jgi:hypothetical protein
VSLAQLPRPLPCQIYERPPGCRSDGERSGRIIAKLQVGAGVSARVIRRSTKFCKGRVGPYGGRLLPVCCPDAPSLTFGTFGHNPADTGDHVSRDRGKGVATAASAGHPPAAATASSHGLEGSGDLLFNV